MDLQQLPEVCVANIVSLTTPEDAFRLSLLSKMFKSAAESDAVWDRFIPPETPEILSESGESGLLAAKSKKELYLALCNKRFLIDDGKLSFSLDKRSGKKCYMISARELGIIWGDAPQYWRWTSHPESRTQDFQPNYIRTSKHNRWSDLIFVFLSNPCMKENKHGLNWSETRPESTTHSFITKHLKRDAVKEKEKEACGTVMDLHQLPEGCIAKIVSLTTPEDACRLSLLCKIFKSAAESDAVWDKFLPPETPTILSQSGESGLLAASSKKELYLALCNKPVLFNDGKLSFSLDKWSGKKCYMISARELGITWGGTPQYWTWTSHPESRFPEVAELLHVCWLEINGKLETRLLSPSTLYKAYLVFKFTRRAYGFEHLPAEVTIGLEGEEQSNETLFPHNEGERPGWLEIELGEFFCEEGEDGLLKMRCLAKEGRHWKSGLIVQGIEVRPKRKY